MNDLPFFDGVSSEFEVAAPTEEQTSNLPNEIPILPLRGLVVYPQTAVPLTIGQPRSIRLVDDAITSDRTIGLVTARNTEIENPTPDDLYDLGTAATIHRMFRAPDGTIRLLVQGIARFKICQITATEPYIKARIEPIPEMRESGLEIEALVRNVRDQFTHISEMIPSFPKELVSTINGLEDPLQIVYTIANFQRMELEDAQTILEFDHVSEKLKKLVTLLVRESEILELGQKIQNEARAKIEKLQREYFLREQIKAIQRELGESEDQTAEIDEFRRKIDEAKLPEEADKQARRELERLSHLPSSVAEYGVIRTYIDWIVSLPWSKITNDILDINHARSILNQDHYGLKDVKERILEYLAVRKLRQERKEILAQSYSDSIRKEREGVILCFIGPPGVGKTSLGQSIARAMGRKFIRTSLGGIRDEAEIRGHRRTYIGAMPGRILQSLRRVESKNPVFMLDEIDKLSFDFHGDPASALLEVLDPEQNFEFRDHYLEVPFDLSQTMFITTANQVETIPIPLLDRMEVIRISGYTEGEKVEIAKHYLIPRQMQEAGLQPNETTLNNDVIRKVIRMYTREAGVRNLERELGSIFRKVATRISENKSFNSSISLDDVKEFLGRRKFFETEEISLRLSLPGVATGLAVTSTGGDILFIESTFMIGSKGFLITGSIGNIMQESAKAAFSYVRSHAKDLKIDHIDFDKIDIHLHIPAGAQPKDGPSAGVTIAASLVSLLTNRLVRADVSMTGELTLLGQVLPVGGIKEKVLAAHRAGLKTVILPARNDGDLDDIAPEIRKDINFVFVDRMDQVLDAAFDPPISLTHINAIDEKLPPGNKHLE